MSFGLGTPGGALGGGFSFSTPAAPTQNSGAAKIVRFDTTTTAAATPFAGFGSTSTAPASSTSTLAGLLGSSTTPASTVGFGAAPSISTGISFGVTSATPALSLSTAVPSLGLAATSTGATTGLTFGPTAASGAVGLGGLAAPIAAPTTTTASLGLGGIGPTISANSSAFKPGDAKTLKETEIPAPILETVNQFLKNVKEQKKVREEIARMSSRPLYQVEEDMKNLRQQLSTISNTLQRYKASIERLKQDTILDLRNSDIAQRTRDIPVGLQFENIAPSEYFERLVDDFHSRISLYRQQIAETESYFSSVANGNGSNPQHLEALLVRLNEGFLSVTAQLQTVHEAVQNQKEAYIRYRKIVLGDVSANDVFTRRLPKPDPRVGRVVRPALPQATLGVSPFITYPPLATSALNTPGPAAAPTGAPTTGLFGGTGGFGTGGGTSMFGGSGTTAAAGTSFFNPAPLSTTPAGGSLFGSTTTSTGGGLFGTPAPTGTTGSIFGATQPQSGGSLFGGMGFGQKSTPTLNLSTRPIG